MAEGMSAQVSRRSTRVFAGEQEAMELGNGGTPMVAYDSRNSSIMDEKDREKDKQQRDVRCSSHDTALETSSIASIDAGRDISGMVPSSSEAIENQLAKSLKAAKTLAKAKQEGRPLNFGVILPNTIYRSSFPQTEDFEYLGSLGLKSIVTLVKKDYPPGFHAFIKQHGIRHYVIDMQGTKKVAIPDNIMNSIMKICLDKENHPLLIHCNHGKHRTGCAAAVIRHVYGWNVQSIVEEYTRFAEPKVRDCDVKYITEYKVSSLSGLFNTALDNRTQRSTSKVGRILGITVLLIGIWITLLKFWNY
ncbi:tyrosine phosphatase protein [Rutstroemia sp. NJR-2017a BBW]|nr:tyrosine phosphatase protein [Rutstroemia sp. NJR-2017a BBW]